ncbi:MAG: hypothetical protein AAF591_12975, partial [Verrucomicrobiota bacterium]
MAVMILTSLWLGSGVSSNAEPLEQQLKFEGTTRKYFVQLPPGFDSAKEYWLLVSVHGGGGNGRSHFLANSLRDAVNTSGFDAIVVSPSFSNEDSQASRFPALG